jgi:hypothetical protein
LIADLPGGSPDLDITTPANPPENLSFQGVSPWSAIADVVSYAGRVIGIDPYTGDAVTFPVDFPQIDLISFREANASELLNDFAPLKRSYGEADEVLVEFAWSDESLRQRFLLSPSTPAIFGGSIGHRVVLSGTRKAHFAGEFVDSPNLEELQSETDAMAEVYRNCCRRDENRFLRKFSGLKQVPIGCQTRKITWRVEEAATTTLIDSGCDIPKVFLRTRPPQRIGAVNAISTTSAIAAKVINESDEVLEFSTFQAEILTDRNPRGDETRKALVRTGRTVDVDFIFTGSNMAVGQRLVIAPKASGGWTIVFWECDD